MDEFKAEGTKSNAYREKAVYYACLQAFGEIIPLRKVYYVGMVLW